MSPAQFAEWRRALGLSQRAAARELGLSLTTVQGYERGALFHRDADGEPRPVEIPRVVELACEALQKRQKPKKRSA